MKLQGERTTEQTSHQKARRDALQNLAEQKPMQKDALYDVQGKGFNIHSKNDMERAYDELASLQRSAIADYSKWAKKEVRYDGLDAETAARNLKQYNDTYTMSMLMGVLSPLERGCSITSVMQCMFSYNIVRVMNPNMDMDTSRFFYNAKNTLAPLIDDLRTDHPVIGRFASALVLNKIPDAFNEFGGASMASTIDLHEKTNDIDSMYFTPRQVAALKLNFMEQYYADLRTTTNPYVQQGYTANYNKAMQHLNAICTHSGYDMSIVGVEEKYLVSLKIKENPNYMTMFTETSDVFGAKVDIDKAMNEGRWLGEFITADEHPVYGDKDLATNGVFHVRKPWTKETMAEDMSFKIKSFEAMREYVHSGACVGDKAALEKQIDEHEQQYLTRMSYMAKTDNVFYKPKSKDKTGESKTEDESQYSQFKDVKSLYANVKAQMTDLNDEHKDLMSTYFTEVDSVLLSKVADRMGYDVKAMRDNDRHAFDPSSEEYMRMLAGVERYARDQGKNIPADKALYNMQVNYFSDCTPEDQYMILAHAVTNVRQGYREHGTDRYGKAVGSRTRVCDILGVDGLTGEDSTTYDLSL